jgi:hypothetical protein
MAPPQVKTCKVCCSCKYQELIPDLITAKYGRIYRGGSFVCNSPKAINWAKLKFDFYSDMDDDVLLGGVLIGWVCWVCNGDWYEHIV